MKKTNQIAVKALLVALLVIVAVSMVACNTTPPDDTPGSGGIGDLSKEEVLGENNVDTSLKEYSANIENLIYETYKTGYIQYAEFVNENRIDELDTEVPALEDLDENVKSILDFIRTTLRDSYMSEKAVENLCNYLIQKAPDVRNKVQSVFDEINKNMSENDEDDYDEDGGTQGSSWLETLYTTDNVKYVSDLYSNLVKLTGAEPMSRIVFELGKVTLNNLIENYSKELEERISERDEYLESIGMSLADFNSYGKAYYNNEWRYKYRLREERKIPSEYDIENALENGYITEDKANELLAQNKQLEQEVKAYVLQEKAKYLSYETQYPELKNHIIIDSSYGEYREYARHYYYYRILNLQEDLAYLTSVVDLLESDSIVNELMPDAINTMMSVMQIAPSVIEVRLSATALTNDILDEITKGNIDSFNVKKQDYVDNFATYKNAIVKLVESYENLNWDSLVTICDKVVSYYENGTFALPDDNYNITSKAMTAIRPALNAVKGKNVIGTVIKWVKRAIEATTADDLSSLDYPTYTSSDETVSDYAMTTEYDYRTNTQTTYVRLLPERMGYWDMYDEGYNGSWVKENPTKVFEDEDALKAWQKDYGKSMYDLYSNYVSEDDYDSDGMRIRYVVELDDTTLDSEIDSNIIDEAILDGTAKIFYENKGYSQWKKQNPNLICGQYISGEAQYYFDFLYTSDTITDEDTLMDTDVYYVAVLDERMSLYAVIEMIGGTANMDTWVKNNYTMTFDSEDALDAWYASSGLVFGEIISGTSDYYYDYIKQQIDSTLYIVELDERKSYTELNNAGCFDSDWIVANATQTFELWKEFNEWKSNNPNRFEDKPFYNYDYTERDGMVYIITYDTPTANPDNLNSYLYLDMIIEKTSISFPRYAQYYSWKHNGGYLYHEYDEHFYVNGQEVSASEYDLAQKRMVAKALQIVVRMTDSNKEEIKAYINDYAKYMDDITKAVEPLYIDYPASETVTFEQFYSAFAKIKDINTQTMTEAQFEAYLDEFEEVAEKYLLYIIPYFMHVVGC